MTLPLLGASYWALLCSGPRRLYFTRQSLSLLAYSRMCVHTCIQMDIPTHITCVWGMWENLSLSVHILYSMAVPLVPGGPVWPCAQVSETRSLDPGVAALIGKW